VDKPGLTMMMAKIPMTYQLSTQRASQWSLSLSPTNERNGAVWLEIHVYTVLANRHDRNPTA